ncbi:MAG: hypothetical protein IT360_26045 [Gemmatimonadaceae bacterium]|nr:hypothetical protein [Gemmatimonadaceae bacterium]
MIVDPGDLSDPRERMFRDVGDPFIHDVFVRDGFGSRDALVVVIGRHTRCRRDQPRAADRSDLLYAAFHNGGVQVLDVSGDLSRCTLLQKSLDGRCDLALMGRRIATGAGGGDADPSHIWRVHLAGSALSASDILHGLARLSALTR